MLADALETRYKYNNSNNNLGSATSGVTTGGSRLDKNNGPRNPFEEPEMTPAFYLPVRTDTRRSHDPEREAADLAYPPTPRAADTRQPQYGATQDIDPLKSNPVSRTGTISTVRSHGGSVFPNDSEVSELESPRPLNYLPVFQPPKFAQLSGTSGAIVEMI